MDVLPADSGEFQLVAAGWGIAHPPGYPLYTLVGALWVHLLPWGSMFHRLNLLSSLLAAITLVMTAQTVMTWTRSQGLSKRASNSNTRPCPNILGPGHHCQHPHAHHALCGLGISRTGPL